MLSKLARPCQAWGWGISWAAGGREGQALRRRLNRGNEGEERKGSREPPMSREIRRKRKERKYITV